MAPRKKKTPVTDVAEQAEHKDLEHEDAKPAEQTEELEEPEEPQEPQEPQELGETPAIRSSRRAIKAPERFEQSEVIVAKPRRGGKKKKGTKAMPAATPKRVKGVRISRPFIIGSEAWELTDSNRNADTPADHTKGWRVYVKGTENGPNITAWLKKVQFKIFHTYANPVRVVEEPPFQIEETGWGGFMVDVKLFFVPEAAAKPETRQHFLQLEPYGDDAAKARQIARKRVTSEYLDIVEFNEPPEALYALLTGDEQWIRPQRKTAKGKAVRAAPDPDGTVELPDSAPEGPDENPFTKEHEATYVAMLEGKIAELEAIKAREEAAARAVLERLEMLRAKRAEQEAATAAATTTTTTAIT